MKDIMKKYKEQKLFSNLNIVIVSLFLAIGINFFLVDGTEIGKNLKTSVLNSQVNEVQSDIYAEISEDSISIKSSKKIKNINSLSLSLSYNPENITIEQVNSNIGDVITLTNVPGISSLILTSDEISNVNSGEEIIKLNLTKKTDKSENINIINANFKDSNSEQFLLSTSGITF